MRSRFTDFGAVAGVVVVLSLAPLKQIGLSSGRPSAAGQAGKAAGKTWNPPRTPDGHPDMQGFWGAAGLSAFYIEEGPAGIDQPRATKSQIVDPPDGKVPYQPWALARKTDNNDHYIDPLTNCFRHGVPRQVYTLHGHQVIQTPGRFVIISERVHDYRIIPTDGSPHLPDSMRLWMGDSRGHWEGDTLVVDVTNLTGKTWLSIVGDFHSDALHVVERFTMVDADTVQYETTLNDPKVFTRPWKMAFPWKRLEKGHEVWEEPCRESDEDLPHLRNLGYKSYFGFDSKY